MITVVRHSPRPTDLKLDEAVELGNMSAAVRQPRVEGRGQITPPRCEVVFYRQGDGGIGCSVWATTATMIARGVAIAPSYKQALTDALDLAGFQIRGETEAQGEREQLIEMLAISAKTLDNRIEVSNEFKELRYLNDAEPQEMSVIQRILGVFQRFKA